jgi:hypothetical protein
MANLGLFDDALEEQAIDCLYRQNQRTLGSCRPPTSMWRTTYFNAFTDGTLESYGGSDTSTWQMDGEIWKGVTLAGFVSYVDGVGLDFTGMGIDRDFVGNSTSSRTDGYTPSVANCADFCRSAGYRYMGMQWTDQCFW